MSRLIDVLDLKRRMCSICNQDRSDEPCDPSDCVFIRATNHEPTLTQLSELTCEGCMYEPDCPSSVHHQSCSRMGTDHHVYSKEGQKDGKSR